MTKTDLQLGGGYVYQWQCAVLLTLNYFFEPVSYDDTLHKLVSKFGRVEAVQLEGQKRRSGAKPEGGGEQGTVVELEDINLLFGTPGEPGARRILIQVKTKEAGHWTPGDDPLRKALYLFYCNASLNQGEADTYFVFLSNRQFNEELDELTKAIEQGTVAACTATDKLYDGVCRYAEKEHDKGRRDLAGKALDKDRFLRMLSKTALVGFLDLDQVKGNVQAKLQGYGRPDWEKAYDRLFSRFAELSTQPSGGRVTRELITEILGPRGKIALAPERHDFYRQIPLTPNYIPRPELLAGVQERLLAGTGPLALTSAIQVKQADVLHGMGGIGKSVLARALCDDPDVQAAFPDGILWATLGQTPDLTARLREWIETLGGIVGQTAPTLDQLRNTLAEVLVDKACLLIVDDAWRKAHLEPFCAGGSASRLVITTRDAALAEGLDAGIYLVPVMAPDQAVALLEEWAQGRLAQVEAEAKAKIVRRLGCLPLAVRLAGAQLRQKDAAEWLASFDARKLKARRVETVHDSLEATFALSLDALAPADRRLYVALAIFKEDEATPPVVISRLWGALDGREADETDETDELLADLADRALLARSQTDGNAVTIHDLLRDFMAAELGEGGRILAHRALLDAYRQTQQGHGWHTAPDDGYLYNHLAYHLDQLAGHDEAAEAELRGLFADQAWLHARVPQSAYRYDGYLADLGTVWRRVQAAVGCQIDADKEPYDLAGCVRYALIRTSINSLAANTVPAVIVQAVRVGLWRLEQALSVLRWVPYPEGRLALAAGLLEANVLPEAAREGVLVEGLAAARAIGYEGFRAQALVALASHLAGELRAEGLAAARAIGDEVFRAEALAALAPHLAGELREQALAEGLAAARAIGDKKYRARALAALAPHLAGALREQALAEGLAAARASGEEGYRAQALAVSLPYVSDSIACLRAIRHAMADQLWKNLADRTREDVLEFCTDEELFTPPILGADTLAAIARHIIEICQHWEWL